MTFDSDLKQIFTEVIVDNYSQIQLLLTSSHKQIQDFQIEGAQ